MSATVIPPDVIARRRAERERQRREREALQGSILTVSFDDEDDPPSAPASPAQQSKETQR